MQITSLAIGGLFVLSLALIGVVVALAFMLRATRALNRQLVPREQNILADRERLWKLNDALAKMLASPDLTARLRITADAISGLGWQEATILLFERSPHGTFTTPLKISRTISNKPNVTTPDASVWQNRLSAVYPKREFGVAQYILAKPEQTAWNDEDVLFIPLRFSDGRLAGVIDLCEPIEGVRPTEERLRPLTILAAQTVALLENSDLLSDLQTAKGALTEQVEELTMLEHVDRELNATLNLDRVMNLTLDWAVRRTGARAGLLAIMTNDGSGLIPLTMLGYPREAHRYNADNPLPITESIMGRTARTGLLNLVRDVTKDADYLPMLVGIQTQISVPMAIQRRVVGVLNLESERLDAFNDKDVEFIKRLAMRAAIAVENARLYDSEERRADEISALYSAGRAISSSLERDQIFPQVAQSVAVMLKVSSAIVATCRLSRAEATIQVTYRLGTATNGSEKLPAEGERWDLNTMPSFYAALQQQRPLSLRRAAPDLSDWERAYMDRLNVKALLLLPLAVQGDVLGVVVALESRRDHIFTQDDILLTESLASQTAVALRQAKLYEEVRELETLKSEMIRMASHDLRNPLGNVMGYMDLLMMQVNSKLNDSQREYVANIRISTNTMKSLIDDLLTLEKIESERQSSWIQLDFGQLVQEVEAIQQMSAALKGQALTLDYDGHPLTTFGSGTQLRQAITNLINNAIKYTPNDGKINVRLHRQDERFYFEVKDTGYGIAPDRQARLFQRFYRAQQPGTEHISGTGLGLSLVKTVIERHGGDVWVTSQLGEGSIFGFWLPSAKGMAANLTSSALAYRDGRTDG